MKQKAYRIQSIWKKIILFFIVLILGLMAIMSITYYRQQSLLRQYRSLIQDVTQISEIDSSIDSMMSDFEEYLYSQKFSSLNSFNSRYDTLYTLMNNLSITYYSEEEYILYENIASELQSFNETMDQAILANRSRNSEAVQSYFKESKKIASYMSTDTNQWIRLHISHMDAIYEELENSSLRFHTEAILIMALLTVISIFLAFRFSKSLLQPLEHLTQTVSDYSVGDNICQITRESNDEIGVLTDGFNEMLGRINNYIDELKQKSIIENNLKLQEMENLRMKNTLDKTRMLALQSQINPHFLYNTLSCMAQTALVEDANDTYILILSLSDMMRYNLINPDVPSTIMLETENIERYLYIQKARFRQHLNYQISIESDDILDYPIPRLTIQPLVENAVEHGLGGNEGDGVVILHIYRKDSNIFISVSDNGAGMDDQTYQKLLSIIRDPEQEIRGTKNTTGIGVGNVIERLRLYYHQEDIIEIQSTLGVGTQYILKLPVREFP